MEHKYANAGTDCGNKVFSNRDIQEEACKLEYTYQVENRVIVRRLTLMYNIYWNFIRITYKNEMVG